jgi:transposase
MIIQIWHSRDSEYEKELYEPIKKSSFFSEYTFIFPHDGKIIDSRESLKTVDLFITEVSYPAIGLGIEIGLASAYEKRILCISRKRTQISNSLKYVTNDFLEYENHEDMIEKIFQFLKSI